MKLEAYQTAINASQTNQLFVAVKREPGGEKRTIGGIKLARRISLTPKGFEVSIPRKMISQPKSAATIRPNNRKLSLMLVRPGHGV